MKKNILSILLSACFFSPLYGEGTGEDPSLTALLQKAGYTLSNIETDPTKKGTAHYLDIKNSFGEWGGIYMLTQGISAGKEAISKLYYCSQEDVAQNNVNKCTGDLLDAEVDAIGAGIIFMTLPGVAKLFAEVGYSAISYPVSYAQQWLYGKELILDTYLPEKAFSADLLNKTYLTCSYKHPADGKKYTSWGLKNSNDTASYTSFSGRWSADTAGNKYFASTTSYSEALDSCLNGIKAAAPNLSPISLPDIEIKVANFGISKSYPIIWYQENDNFAHKVMRFGAGEIPDYQDKKDLKYVMTLSLLKYVDAYKNGMQTQVTMAAEPPSMQKAYRKENTAKVKKPLPSSITPPVVIK